MTVHARRLARICRERLAAHETLPALKQQPEQQQQAVTDSRQPKGAVQPAR